MFVRNKNKLIKESGQIALVVLLASALVLTVSMSISRKTVVETRIDTDEELLKQAFNTAESGIEYYLATGENEYGNGEEGSASIDAVPIGGDTSIDSGGAVLDGNPFLFWLVEHDGVDISDNEEDRYDGDFNSICVAAGDNFNGALKVDLYSYDGTYAVDRYIYNINSSLISEANGSGTLCSSAINGINNGMLLVVTPIGGSANLTVSGSGGDSFPTQGETITSVGEMVSGVNTTVRVENRFEVPVFMLEAISAGGQVSNSL